MGTVGIFEQPGVRGFLHRPDAEPEYGLVLTHGASGNARTPLLTAAAEAFAAAGFCVLRCDLPFRQRRAAGPPSPSRAAEDRAGLRDAVTVLQASVPGRRVYLGGHSYGGRQATMLAADDAAVAASLLLFSYPLHPPGKPERLRTEHFPRLRAPAVFVHGDRDPFGSHDELRSAVTAIPAPTRIVAIDRAGHDLRRGRFDLMALPGLLLEIGAR